MLIVCSANICRSPAAAALLRFHLRHRGAGRRIAVVSAGTDVAAPGAAADPRMVSIAAESGVRLQRSGARQVDEEMLQLPGPVWVMEQRHREQLTHRWPALSRRVELLDPAGADVPDPYFGDKAGVRRTFEALDALCRVRAEMLLDMLPA